jgi:hypothetical protein
MSRVAATAGLGVVGAVAAVLLVRPLTPAAQPTHQAQVPALVGDAASALRLPAPPVGHRAASVARRWVQAAFSRAPGDGPGAWLAGVADITHPDLAADLGQVRPWATDDVLSSTVTVTGVYTHAANPAVVTVACVTDVRTATGLRRDPCVATVTVAWGPDGRLLVVAFR